MKPKKQVILIIILLILISLLFSCDQFLEISINGNQKYIFSTNEFKISIFGATMGGVHFQINFDIDSQKSISINMNNIIINYKDEDINYYWTDENGIKIVKVDNILGKKRIELHFDIFKGTKIGDEIFVNIKDIINEDLEKIKNVEYLKLSVLNI
jgi:hypothetical protein